MPAPTATTIVTPPPVARGPSAQLGERYEFVRELGRGGMGTVHLVRDRRLDRLAALKLLPPDLATDAALRERFLRETRLAASFSHPNIVPVFAIEEGDDFLAFAMGYVEGESLAERVARTGPLPVREIVRLVQDVAWALAYAHGRGVVHRDIKPENIMLERATGRALVMDFGIARSIAAAATNESRPGLTRVGEVVGTPEYMSPEQAAGESLDGRSDIYALGLVAWFACAGTTAITGETTQRILVRQLTEAVPPVARERPELPPALASLIDRCTAKEPADRPQDAAAIVEALDAARLAAPEIPVAVRLLVPELGAVGARVLLALLLWIPALAEFVMSDDGNWLVAAIVVTAVAWVRGAQVVREVRRLRAAGFGVAELQQQLRRVIEEWRAERAARRLDATLLARRRRQVRLWSVLLLVQLAVLAPLLASGWHPSPTGTGGRFALTLGGPATAIRFFGGLLVTALCIAGLARSPFRGTIGETLFERWWLGDAGGAALRAMGVARVARPTAGPLAAGLPAARGSATTVAVAAGASPAPRRPTTSIPHSARLGAPDGLADRVDAIEARLRAIEARLDD
ncbi:MAG: serine/threonine protein kinase [Gemmatimonadaceae bacterium]|nr:serine/threonine protein kinase [Gemmatimonadaceae bacterium]